MLSSPSPAAAATPPRTPKSTPRKTNENSGNVPVAPWSRSKVDRFAGGIYKASQEPKVPTPRKNNTPSKATGLPAPTERYATTAELARHAAPHNTTAPSAAYSSATDRFTLPGSVHEAPKTPGVGTYEAKGQEARVLGAVKLQKAIRRRQSRGIFAQLESEARETPGVGDYTPSVETVSEGGAGHAPFSKGSRSRFADSGSIYPSRGKAPAVGDYDPTPAHEVAGGGAKSSFRGHMDRFANGIYAGGEVPGVGDYEVAPEPALTSTQPSASYRGKAFGPGFTDRFGGQVGHSVYAASDAPGVGAYDPSVAEGGLTASSKQNATFSSKTDRFTSRDGVHAATKAATPGAGAYDAKGHTVESARVLGAVKLQKAIRRRQSRGIFAQIESAAREVPSPTRYAPVIESADSLTTGAGFSKGGRSRFTDNQSIYKRDATPAAGEYDATAASTIGATNTMPSAIGRSATARFEGYNSHFGAAGTPTKGASAAAKGATPAKQSTPAKTATPSRTPSKAIPKLTPSQLTSKGATPSKSATKSSANKSKIPTWVKQPKHLTAAAAAEQALAGAFDDLEPPLDGAAPLSAGAEVEDELGTTCHSIATMQKRDVTWNQKDAASRAEAPSGNAGVKPSQVVMSPKPVIVHGPSLDSMFCNDSRSPSLASEASPTKLEKIAAIALPDCSGFTSSECGRASTERASLGGYSVGGTAIGVYNGPRFSGASHASFFSEGGTALDAYVPPSFGLANVKEVPEANADAADAAPGEQWYSFRSSFQSSEAFEEVEAAVEAEVEAEVAQAAEEGQKLFATLSALDGTITRDDYFSVADGWDVAGLKSDLKIAQQA